MADDTDFSEEAEKRLDDLGQRIEEVRKSPETEEVMGGSFDEGDEQFHESGEPSGDQDDQTIAPPG